ncbi:MAG: NADAR family protein [Bacteroidales bacterium]
MTKYKFFWKGVLSNWQPSRFCIDGVVFCCGEQAMMYYKAMLFADYETARLILDTKNPKEIKALGRKVRNFDNGLWDNFKVAIVTNIIRARMLQDTKFAKEVIKFKSYHFVEASPYDRIWGIGYEEHNALANKDKWGENLLGEAINQVVIEVYKLENCTIKQNLLSTYEG